MRRQALGGGQTFSPLGDDLPLYGPFGALNPSGDLIVETRGWRERMFEQRAPERTSPYPGWAQRVGNLVNQGVFPGMMGGGMGQLALNQLLVVMDGIDNPPFMRRFIDEQGQLVPRCRLHRAAAPRPGQPPPAPAASARRADLLHRGHERADREPRPGPHAPGPDGAPRLVPHPDQGRPQGHLRPLPRARRARRRARHAGATRRDRADHERVLAGDDRADLLDGADERAPRGAARLHLDPSRRRDDRDRVGHGGRRPLRRARDARGRDPRGGPRSVRARLPARPRVEQAVDQDARRLARPPPGVPEGGALQPVAQRGDGRPRARARRDGRRVRLLRRDLERRRRRPPVRDLPRRDDGRRGRHGPAARRAELGHVRRRERGADARADHEALRAGRIAADEPDARRRAAGRPDRIGARAIHASGRSRPRSSASRSSPPWRSCARTGRRSNGSRTP